MLQVKQRHSKMPRKYVRNHKVGRGQWTEENLKLAIDKVKKGEISKNEAQRCYGIPIRTLSRRLKTGNTTKSGLGPQASLGTENEKQLASYIKRLANAGFAPDRNTIRSLAYQFAEKFGIKHKFSKEKEKAGQHWITSFLERNKDISVRQAEGLSVARAQGMNREEVSALFKLLEEEMIKNDLMNKPETLQVACVLTSPENLNKKTSNLDVIKGAAKKRKLPGAKSASSSSQQIASSPIEDDTNVCTECWENYYLTKKKTDWIKCSSCLKWLHESCTMYSPHCNNCGREMLRKRNHQ